MKAKFFWQVIKEKEWPAKTVSLFLVFPELKLGEIEGLKTQNRCYSV